MSQVVSYNVTIKVEWLIATEWLKWEQEDHIPAMMATGYFDHWKMYRLLEQDDQDGPTYTIQLFTGSEKRYQDYVQAYADLFRQQVADKWKDRFMAYHSAMIQVK
jgi:hypothetical protein